MTKVYSQRKQGNSSFKSKPSNSSFKTDKFKTNSHSDSGFKKKYPSQFNADERRKPFGSSLENRKRSFGGSPEYRKSPVGSSLENRKSTFGSNPENRKSTFGSNSEYRKSPFGSNPENKKRPFKSSSENRSSFSRNNFGNRNSFSSFGNRNSRSRRRNRKDEKSIDPKLFVSDGSPIIENINNYVGKSYSDFNFSRTLNLNLENKGFEKTTEIQELAIPKIMNGQNLLGISQTGSGKTGAFLIAFIEKLIKDPHEKLLIVAPTRELATQISNEAISLIKGTNIFMSLVVGGESIYGQTNQLKKDDRLVIGTPGRLNDMIKRGVYKSSKTNNIVIDEVDRMFDMGFIDDIKQIFKSINDKKQAVFFSATHNKKVENIANELVGEFEIIKIAQNIASKSVKQDVIEYSGKDEKFELIKALLIKDEVKKSIIFVETKRFADEVDKHLFDSNFKVGVIHGDKKQAFRKKIIQKFRHSKIDHLVATNVAARGIDIEDITHVINLDEPQSYDEYIHRIGRTGRNGKTGSAYTFLKRK